MRVKTFNTEEELNEYLEKADNSGIKDIKFVSNVVYKEEDEEIFESVDRFLVIEN